MSDLEENLSQSAAVPEEKNDARHWFFFAGLMGREGLSVLYATLASAAAMLLLHNLGPRWGTEAVAEFLDQAVMTIAYLLPFVLFIVFYRGMARVSLRELLPSEKIDGKTFLACLGLCLGLTVFGNYVTALLQNAAGLLGFQFVAPGEEIPQSFWATVLFVINCAVLPPIFEEICFRGIATHALRKTGYFACIGLTAFVFAMGHGNLLQIPMAFCMGLGAGYVTLRFRNIWVGIAAHFVNNALYVLLQLMLRDGWELQAGLLDMLLGLVLVLGGVLGLVYLFVRYGEGLDDFGLPPRTGALRKAALNPLALLLFVFYGLITLLSIRFVG